MMIDNELWTIRSVNTHCHHLRKEWFQGISLHQLLQMTYVSWVCPDQGDTFEGHCGYFSKMGTSSSFYWWRAAIEQLYGDGRTLSPDNWNWFDDRVKRAYEKDGYDLELLKDRCGYDSILLDDYEAPGEDHGRPDLMKPVFRCDMFLCGYTYGKTDENHNHAYDYFEKRPGSLDEYVKEMEKAVQKAKERGAIGLKIAIAYERSLQFSPDSRKKALEAFGNERADEESRKAFGDYIMYELAQIAAGLSLPIQIHTGLGKLDNSRAMGLRDLIAASPDTKFDLFHGSYPWCDDVLGLAHYFPNVYVDLCWMPLLSSTRAISFLKEALELVGSKRILWGCDTWTSEESYGARMAAHYCIRQAWEGCTHGGITGITPVGECARDILFQNAADLYHL